MSSRQLRSQKAILLILGGLAAALGGIAAAAPARADMAWVYVGGAIMALIVVLARQLMRGFGGAGHGGGADSAADRLADIRCPVLVMVGEHDHGTPPEAARVIHQNLAGSELKIIPSAAHLSNVEQTQIFNDAMLAFLNRVAR